MRQFPIGGPALAALAALLAGALLAAPAGAAAPGPNQARVTGGQTTLKLGSTVSIRLRAAGIRVSTVAPARKSPSGLVLPISSGAVNPARLRGTVNHRGSIRFSARGRSVVLSSPRYAITSNGSAMSARVGGKRLLILRLAVSKAIIGGDGPLSVTARNIRATLDRQGARALNAAFGTSRFRAGLPIGTISTRVTLGDVLIRAGATTLTPGPDVSAALAAFGVTLTAAGKATAGEAGLGFPITTGKINGKTLRGTVQHGGSGIAISRETASLTLTDFVIRIDSTPTLSALVGGTRVEVLALDVSAMQSARTPTGITLTNIGATLTEAATAALNQAFGTTVFSPGLALGTVTVSGRIR